MDKWVREDDSDALLLNTFKWRVVDWNLLARGEHGFSIESQVKQSRLIEEERQETLKALREDSKVEFLDGLCDLFVTTVYLEFLLGQTKTFYPDSVTITDWDSSLEDLSCCLSSSPLVVSMMRRFDGDWRGALTEVLDSNDSKFDSVPEDWRSSSYLYQDLVDGHCRKLSRECGLVVHYEERKHEGETLIVYLDSSNKVRKGFQYWAPNLERYLYDD